MAKTARVIYWFRTDLRLHDSPALKAAIDLNPENLWPIFTWDPHYVYRATCGSNRWQFLLDCQNDLSASITKLNPKSKLFVLREAPQSLLPKLFKAWNVTHLVFEKDTDAYARDRDHAVLQSANDAGVQVITKPGRTLWDSDALVAANDNKPTMTITQLQKAGAKLGPVAPALPAPTSLPDPGPMPTAVLTSAHARPPADPDHNAAWRPLDDRGYLHLAGPARDFAPATLAELGFAPATTPHRGGETAALARLAAVVADVRYAATFRKPQTSPAAFAPPSTTLLSPFLHFGALSVRLFYHRVEEARRAYQGKDASGPPESLTGQLLFRDMYFAAQAALGHAFAQTRHNPVIRFVPWHLPSQYAPSTALATSTTTTTSSSSSRRLAAPKELALPDQYTVDSRQADEWFRRWAAGTTGFPWIDALMRQLRADGWIHHLGRHAVACFLTRGGCLVHWERGAAVFAALLLDHEPACNTGNWQWLACAAFCAQFHRCYSPTAFPARWDPSGALVRRWCPELARLDARHIYEPWTAPAAALRAAGVALVPLPAAGAAALPPGAYPLPMFDFAERRTICLASMKKAYAVGLRGNDERVLDGSFRALFAGGGEHVETRGPIHDGDEAEGEWEGQAPKKEKKDGINKRAKGPMDRHVKRQKT